MIGSRTAVALALLGALSACGREGAGDQPPVAPKAIGMANPFHEQLTALPPQLQKLTLWRALRDSGTRCRRVEAGGFQGDHENLKMWVARCEDGRHHAVFLAPNADVQVRNCEEAAQLGLPQCRPLPQAPAG